MSVLACECVHLSVDMYVHVRACVCGGGGGGA